MLIDPPQYVYLILGGLLVVTGVIAAQRQDRRSTIRFGIAFLLMAVVFLIDRLNESPREEAARRTYLMAQAADAKNPDAFVEHVADTFVYQNTPSGQPHTVTREQLRASPFWGMLKQNNVRVVAWGFSRDDVRVIDDNAIEIGFSAKGERGLGDYVQIYARATYTRQPDGKLKMTAFSTIDPIDHTKPLSIPMFP